MASTRSPSCSAERAFVDGAHQRRTGHLARRDRFEEMVSVMIDFELPAELAALRDRVSRFITDKIVPFENDPRQGPHGAEEPLRRELNALAREAGLLSPHGPKEYGGLGLDHRSMAVVFEVA